MSRISGESKRDTNLKTAQMVQLISEIGPDIPEIARRLGQFKESVRYRYKQKILNRGFAIQAMADYEKLGLRHLETVVDFTDELREYAQSILMAMSELCYVSGFERLFPRGNYVVGADVPEEFVDDYTNLMKRLQQKGMFSFVEVHAFDWFRRIPMQTQFYDFNARRWDFDWSAQTGGDFRVAAYLPSERGSFDFIDLLILKELYMDATRSLVEISRKLKVNYKKLVWHYSTHVVGSGLIRGYTVRWPGTKYDYKVERASQRQHKYFWIDLLVRDLNGAKRMELMARVNRLPFVWAEAGGKGYFAQLAIPLDFYTEAMQYLEGILGPVRDRAELYLPDQTSGLAFTTSYKLYDQNSERWTFEVNDLDTKFDELILKIKEGRG